MKKKKTVNKFYAVKCGRKTGVFTDLREATKQINGYSNADWRVFDTRKKAKAYLRKDDNTSRSENHTVATSEIIQTNTASIDKGVHFWTDGSFRPDILKSGYGFCCVINGKLDSIYSNRLNDINGWMGAPICEYSAICAAVLKAWTSGYKTITIHCDSEHAIKAVKPDKETNYSNLMRFFRKQGINISLEHVTAHADDVYNSLAHFLARRSLSICDQKAEEHIEKLEKILRSDKSADKKSKKIQKHLTALNEIDRKLKENVS